MSDFLEPIGNEEAILQNILGANNELLPPMSRNEKILLDILGEDYPIEPPMSRMEALLIALKEKIEHDTPSGKISITENGNDINIAQYATADVNVPSVQPTGTINITQNGTANVAQYAEANVAVPTATLGTKSITANGTYAASADNLDGYSSVTVNCPDKAYELLAKTIKSLTVPNTTTILRSYLCYQCTQLEEIIFEETSTLNRIDQDCFHGCTALKNLAIPDSVANIYQNAFDSCTGLLSVSLPNNLTVISNYVFSFCTALPHITLPQSLITIGSASFRHLNSLTSIKFPATLTTIGASAFEYCGSLLEIDCTELTVTNGEVNTSINANSFAHNSANMQFIFADEATMNVYKTASNWITYASQMTYRGA